ncbi:cysteine--tRNA ligase [Candidatus Gottesmanbacteria bacterium]|nr:cysteine--tRNA ligase [Candidatus Gottesmanbacteria bacterium]
MLNLYNTLTRQKEEFKPLHPPVVTYYSCGPTVYDFAHIGHARTFIFADVLQRALELNGYQVKRVMNITDVGHLTSDRDSGEDKMEKGAKRENKSVWDIAEFYTKDFMQMLDQLNIKVPEIICKATDNIDSMIQIISTLQEKGFTYKIRDGIYFDTTKFPDYGKLTGQSFASLQNTLKAGARIEMVEGKKHPTDFALWKFSPSESSGLPKRQMEWDSPFAPTQGRGKGKGFPGWHIECSAMSIKFLGQTIDIHTGGVDHIPIHHTNEIAQSEAASGKLFVRFWLHAEHLTVEGEKMSKSLHNFFRLQDLNEKGFDSLSLRYLFLTAHYHTAMNFTWKAMEGAQTALANLREQISNFQFPISNKKGVSLLDAKSGGINEYKNKFISAVNNDLNIPQSLAVMWEMLKSNLSASEKYDLVLYFDKVLGLDLDQITENRDQRTIPPEIMELSALREKYRQEKKWSESDEVRAKIEKQGFTVEDTNNGTIIKKN